MMPREPIPTVVRKLAKELAEPTPMRRGSVSERFMKCGQKECRCQHDPQARHGPYFTLTRSEEGKTRSRYLSAEQAALARQHVEAGHEFRKQVERYWQGHELLHELAGVDVPTKHVERAAEALGREVAEDEKLVVEPPEPNEPLAPTLYLGMDGTGVPVRKKELVDRPGKQPDGSSKTREVKLVTIWSAEGRDKEGTPVRDAGSITYSAAIESAAHKDTDATPSEFAARVEREATRRGFERAARQAVLGDGAIWIWNLTDEHFPDAVQIVDRFHAKQHLSDVSKSIYGAGTDLAQQWASERHDELDAGDIDDILDALRLHSPQDDEARKCIDYVERNQERMRYPKFRAAGLCTSTGVVEAGCKVAIGTRCKRAGMHWTVAGVDAIIALRCCKLSGRFEGFWERRAQRQVA